MSANLKPCPFCGGEAVEDRDCAGFHNYRCLKCKCALYGDFEHHMTGRAAWNRRAPAAPTDALPHNWKPTPYEATETMVSSAKQQDPALTVSDVRALWSSMWKAVAAAPTDAPEELRKAHTLLDKHCVADVDGGKPATLEARIAELWSWYEQAAPTDAKQDGALIDEGTKIDAQSVRDAALEEAARNVEDFQADNGEVSFNDIALSIRALIQSPTDTGERDA